MANRHQQAWRGAGRLRRSEIASTRHSKSAGGWRTATADATVGAKPNLTRTPNLTRVHRGAPALAPQHRAPLVRINLRGGAHRNYAVGSFRLPARTPKQRCRQIGREHV